MRAEVYCHGGHLLFVFRPIDSHRLHPASTPLYTPLPASSIFRRVSGVSASSVP